MPVAHLIRVVQDAITGELVAGAQVSICNPGTETPISAQLYSDVDLTQPLSNPFVSLDGTVDVYLEEPRTVLIKTSYGAINVTEDYVPILPKVEHMMVSDAPITITNVPASNQILSATDANTATWVDPAPEGPTDDQLLVAWFRSEAYTPTDITLNGDGAWSTANVLWPDGADGVFTTDSFSIEFPGLVDAWNITWVTDDVTKTLSQPAVTRDADGNVIATPEVVITG